MWNVHLDFGKPEGLSGQPVTIYYLPGVSLEFLGFRAGTVPHLPDDFEQGIFLQMPGTVHVFWAIKYSQLEKVSLKEKKTLTNHFC